MGTLLKTNGDKNTQKKRKSDTCRVGKTKRTEAGKERLRSKGTIC